MLPSFPRMGDFQAQILYLTVPYLRGGQVVHQIWGQIISAHCAAPNVTEGHISLLVVLANRIRDIGWTLLSSSSSSRWDPKIEYLSWIRAGHVPRNWKVVPSSSSHAGQSGSFRSFITLKCLLSVEWPVRRPTRTLMSRLMSFKFCFFCNLWLWLRLQEWIVTKWLEIFQDNLQTVAATLLRVSWALLRLLAYTVSRLAAT